MPRALVPQEEIFVAEYCLDWNAPRAALAAGYKRTMGSRLLKAVRIAQAVEMEKEARRDRLRVDTDRITEEFARIAYSNARDYVPRKGEDAIDVHQLNVDQTAAIEQVDLEDTIDPRTGVPKRRMHLKLHDKVAALNSLAKSVGMLAERHIVEGTIEHIISQLTPEERLERIKQLRDKARQVYLPAYEKMLAEQNKTIEGEAIEVSDEEAGEQSKDAPVQTEQWHERHDV